MSNTIPHPAPSPSLEADLQGRVCLVAGATRGAGRAIATALGACGATVYATGRSTRQKPGARPEVIEETADLVSAAGGVGIAVGVDHSDIAQVDALCARIGRDHGGLDVLINDVWGGEALMEFGVPFWQCSLEKGHAMVQQAVLTHATTARLAVPLMLDRPRGLIVEVTDGDTFGYRGMYFYDVVKMAVIRMAFAMSRDLKHTPHTALAVTPGFLRSEEMLAHMGVTEANWRDGAKVDPHFIASESPAFVGRAIAALARDPAVKQKAGRVFSSWDLADEYGFDDVDGSRPHWRHYFERAFLHPYTRADEAAYASWLNSPTEIAVEAFVEQQKKSGAST